MLGFGVCAWIYGDAPLDATLGRIAAAGYDGVEVPGEPGLFVEPKRPPSQAWQSHFIAFSVLPA